MDKWQKRAAERRKQREKQLRQRMMIAGGAVVALLVVILIITRVAGGSKVEKKGSSSEAASSSVSSENAAVSGTNGVAGDTAGITADTSATDSVLVATVTGEIAPDEATVTPNPDDPRAIFAVDPNRTDWNFDKDGDKVVYLTLDDGPSYLTMQFLDMLDACDVKATFFVTSQDPSYADCSATRLAMSPLLSDSPADPPTRGLPGMPRESWQNLRRKCKSAAISTGIGMRRPETEICYRSRRKSQRQLPAIITIL